jgi:ATP-dependent Clp protease ATP-binding subunit ClpA
MWQRFTERARRAVFFAQEEAAHFFEYYVSTEHLLLGLIREEDSVAARVLERMGVSRKRVLVEVKRRMTPGDAQKKSQDMQLTPRAKRVIDLAYDEARQLSNNYIGTEHLLLGLIREGEGLAGRVLEALGVELTRARSEILAYQTGERRAPVVHKSEEYVHEFGAAYLNLPAEQRDALAGDGEPLGQLPEPMTEIIRKMVNMHARGDTFILDPGGPVRVTVTPLEGGTHYTVVAKTSFLINLLVKEENLAPSPLEDISEEAEESKEEEDKGQEETE